MNKSKIWMPIVMIVAIVLADQISKGVLLYLLTGGVPVHSDAFALLPYPYMIARISSFFNIVFTWNPGTSFSLFRALGESAPMILIALSALIIGGVGYSLFKRTHKSLEKWGLVLIIGGALGNLIDRVRFGAVIDFLDFHIKTWHWPAFNIADVCICAGVVLYVLHWVFFQSKKKGNNG
jgi:signal peptidase II